MQRALASCQRHHRQTIQQFMSKTAPPKVSLSAVHSTVILLKASAFRQRPHAHTELYLDLQTAVHSKQMDGCVGKFKTQSPSVGPNPFQGKEGKCDQSKFCILNRTLWFFSFQFKFQLLLWSRGVLMHMAVPSMLNDI